MAIGKVQAVFACAAHFHSVYVIMALGCSHAPCTFCHWNVLTGRLIFVLHAYSCSLHAVLCFCFVSVIKKEIINTPTKVNIATVIL